MTPEESKELKELVEFLKENQIGEFEFERADVKVRIKFAAPSASGLPGGPGPAGHAESHPRQEPASNKDASSSASDASTAASGGEAGLHIVKSPIVGTFYESAAPGAPAFVKIGDKVESGQVLCIVEAMKLMNEIESDAAGELVQRFVSSGQPVEYGQPLFSLRCR